MQKGRRERHTSNSGSLNNMGRVPDVSSLCLDCKKKGGGGRDRRKEISKHVYGVSRKKALRIRKNGEEARLDITFSPFSGGRQRGRRCLPLDTSGLGGRRSINR